jgi:hypothetical protein
MAKRLCDPTSGKIGREVYQNSRNGQTVRIRAIPTNPQTTAQVEARDNLTACALAYDALTEVQQNAWIAAAAEVQSRTRLGMSGPLTGLQYYCKVNAALLETGSVQVNAPPATPTFEESNWGVLTAVNATGTLTMKVANSDTQAGDWHVFAAGPVNSGVRRQPDLVRIGAAPTIAAGFSTITTIYQNRFGVPAVGKRIHVRVVEIVNGLYGAAHNVTCLVTAS